MIIPVDKGKILNEFNEKYVKQRFLHEVPKIYEKYDGSKEEIEEEIISKFNEVCAYAKNLQDKALKGEIKYIYISYLRTSLIENNGVYRIDMYDDKWFLDKEECFIDINFDFIFEPLFIHMGELEEYKKEYGRNISSMDIERIRLKEGDKYHNLTIKILESLINDFLECDEYEAMKKHEKIMILAGEYRDAAVLLYENK